MYHGGPVGWTFYLSGSFWALFSGLSHFSSHFGTFVFQLNLVLCRFFWHNPTPLPLTIGPRVTRGDLSGGLFISSAGFWTSFFRLLSGISLFF